MEVPFTQDEEGYVLTNQQKYELLVDSIECVIRASIISDTLWHTCSTCSNTGNLELYKKYRQNCIAYFNRKDIPYGEEYDETGHWFILRRTDTIPDEIYDDLYNKTYGKE